MCCFWIPKTSFDYRSCHETPHSLATLFSEFDVILPHSFSIVTTASQLFSDHLNSSQFLQLFSTALKVVPSLLPLSSTLFTSSLLFSTFPNDSHLCPPRLHSSQLLSTRFSSSSTLPTSSHLRLRSTHLTSSSHLFLSPSQLFSPIQLWPALLNSSHLLSQRC